MIAGRGPDDGVFEPMNRALLPSVIVILFDLFCYRKIDGSAVRSPNPIRYRARKWPCLSRMVDSIRICEEK